MIWNRITFTIFFWQKGHRSPPRFKEEIQMPSIDQRRVRSQGQMHICDENYRFGYLWRQLSATVSFFHWKSKRVLQKHLLHFIDYAKAFDCVDHNKLLNILQEMRISDHLTCLLRNLYAGQEATIRTRHGTTGYFQTGEEVHQCCILSPCLFNLYAEYFMRNGGLDEAGAGIKIARRNIKNLPDDTTLMAES